jgi:translocation and assembly module TamB
VERSGPSAGRIEGEVTAVHFPLRFFALVRDPGRVQGHADGTVRWRGTLEKPVLEGALSFSGVRFTLPESDLVLLFEGRLKAAEDRLRFEEVKVTTPEGGAARLEGELEFKGFLVRRIALRAWGEDFPFVLFRDLSGMADFDLALEGPPAAPVLSGKARILKGRIQLPDVARLAPLPPSIRFVNAPKGSPYAEPDLEQDFLSRIRGSLEVSTETKFWAVNRSILAELSGNLTLAFTPGGQTLSGTLQILSGRYLFQGLKFDLADSRIHFKGTTDWTPILDLTARRQAPGAEVTARVQGSADHPTLTLSSSPPMEQGDILATLLFGRSRNLSAGENAQWGSAAAALAFQYRAGGLLESVQHRLNVDSFSVGADPLGGPQVGFSKYIGDRTVLEYYQTFGVLPEGRLNLRYRINRNLSVQSESSTLGRSGVDLLWERRY